MAPCRADDPPDHGIGVAGATVSFLGEGSSLRPTDVSHAEREGMVPDRDHLVVKHARAGRTITSGTPIVKMGHGVAPERVCDRRGLRRGLVRARLNRGYWNVLPLSCTAFHCDMVTSRLPAHRHFAEEPTL